MERFLGLLRGHRKMLMFAIVAVIAALVPLNENQADVLKTLTVAGMGSNALVHLGEVFRGKVGVRIGGAGGNSAGAAGVSQEG